MCPLHKDLLDLTQPHAASGLFTAGALSCIDEERVRGVVKHALARRGVTSISGPFGFGKSSLVVPIVQALLNVGAAMKTEREKARQSSVAKVHTIAELMAMEDSDEDMQADPRDLFPWHQPSYENVYDQNDQLVKVNARRAKAPGYDTAVISDKHVIIKHKTEA